MLLSTMRGVHKAALEIAYDNGGINRFRTEQTHARELNAFLSLGSLPLELRAVLPAIDEWLLSRSDEQMATICCGEESEQAAALQHAPFGTDNLLNLIFENVC